MRGTATVVSAGCVYSALFLAFTGFVHIGCSVGGSSNNPTFTNCNGAVELEEGGAVLCLLAVVFFVAALIPDSSSRYK